MSETNRLNNEIFEPPGLSDMIDKFPEFKSKLSEKTHENSENKTEDIEFKEHKKSNKQKLVIENKPGFFVAVALNDTKNKNIASDVKDKVDKMLKNPYIKRNSILTDAELKLYRLLIDILPIDKVTVAPKVRIADILDTYESLKNGLDNPIYKITSKHIDFTICDKLTMEPVCLIELDDVYHYKSDKIARDNFVDSIMRDVGLELFRVKKKISDVTENDLMIIKEYVYNRYAPMCSICGAPMIFRQSKQKSNYGHMFYCCSNFNSKKRCYWQVDIGY